MIFLIPIILTLITMYKFTGLDAIIEHKTFEAPSEIKSATEHLTSKVPFRESLERQPQSKPGNLNHTLSVEGTLSKDPFKEFLDKQKQTSIDQVVSPFGKN